jgi:hypothetical protein
MGSPVVNKRPPNAKPPDCGFSAHGRPLCPMT